MTPVAPDRNKPSGGLAVADSAALERPDRPAGTTLVPCPLQQPESKRFALEVEVVGEDGKPLEGIAVELQKTPAQVLSGRTSLAGLARFEQIEAGVYKICLPELDAEAWELLSTAALPEDKAKSAGDAPWAAPEPPDGGKEFTHPAVQGECIPKLAERFGFFPETIWNHPGNKDLAAKRKDRNILNPGDNVVIPARRPKTIDGVSAKTHNLKRKGVPEVLRIRFLDDGKPRAGESYLLSLTASTGEPIEDRTGTLDGDGFLEQSVPPTVTHATVTVGQGEEQQVHRFAVSHLDPIDTISGIKGRLHALMYYDGPIDNELNWLTTSAVVAFQMGFELEPNGDPKDAKFLAELERVYCS